jgi:hypothetical protein
VGAIISEALHRHTESVLVAWHFRLIAERYREASVYKTNECFGRSAWSLAPPPIDGPATGAAPGGVSPWRVSQSDTAGKWTSVGFGSGPRIQRNDVGASRGPIKVEALV